MKPKIIKYIKICLIVLALEVILFNITSFRNFFGNYTIKEFSKENLEVISTENGKSKILIDNINVPVATIKLELSQTQEIYEYRYHYSDETTTEGYMSLPIKKYLPDEARTHYIPTYLSGNVKSLLLEIDEIVIEQNLIEKIVVNEKIPFDFNFARVILLILTIAIIDFFKNSKIMSENYEPKNLDQELVLLVVLFIFILILTFISVNSKSDEDTDMYNKGLVEAFLNKQLYLLEEPSVEFESLENPYDVSVRNNSTVERGRDYVWDSAYYDGKFYVYFGVLPVLVIFLPFYLLTGEYLHCSLACFIISAIIFVLLKEILCKFFKRFFKELPFKLVAFSLIVLYSGSLILYINGCTRFYEVAILSGVCCVLTGILFAFKSMEEPEKKYRYIFLSCLFMALSVACRPTNLFSSILIVPYLWKEFTKEIKQFKEEKKSLIKCVLSIAVPYLMVAIPLMWYNYARFESIFEFGANYQLTINNIKELRSRIFAIPAGLLCNLFSIPKFMPVFPYIQNYNEISTFYGYYFVEDMIGGLFILAPICFLCFFVYKIHKKTENTELKIWIYSLIIIGILIATISVAKGGSIERYLIDYAWMFVLAGILIFTTIYQFLKTEEAKKILMKIFTMIAIYMLIINIFAGIVGEKRYFERFSSEVFYKIRYSINFWE